MFGRAKRRLCMTTNRIAPIAWPRPLSKYFLYMCVSNATSLSADAAADSELEQGLLHKSECWLVASGCFHPHSVLSSLALLSYTVAFLLSDTRTMKNRTFRRIMKLTQTSRTAGRCVMTVGDRLYVLQSDSCGTVDRGPSNSTEVYNYKTLAYSGGTLPRNFKKVRALHLKLEIQLLYLTP